MLFKSRNVVPVHHKNIVDLLTVYTFTNQHNLIKRTRTQTFKKKHEVIFSMIVI